MLSVVGYFIDKKFKQVTSFENNDREIVVFSPVFSFEDSYRGKISCRHGIETISCLYLVQICNSYTKSKASSVRYKMELLSKL